MSLWQIGVGHSIIDCMASFMLRLARYGRSGRYGGVVFLLFLLAIPGYAEQRRSIVSAEQLRRELLISQERVQSIRVVYQAQGYDDSFPKGTYLHRVVAAKAPNLYFFSTAHGFEGLYWGDDPLQSRVYVTSKRWFVEYPVNRCYYVETCAADDPLPGSLKDELFGLATGLFPAHLRRRPYADEYPITLRDVAKSKRHSIVRPKQEMVGGRWCHVLESKGRDVLWIDVSRGCTLMARDLHHPPTGARMSRFELARHKEGAPGIWIPGTIRNIGFDYTARTEEGRQRKIKDGLIEIVEASVNDVDQSTFEYQPLPGAVLVREGAAPVQTHPGGLDHLDYLVGWVRRYAPPVRPLTQSVLGYFAVLPALVIILVLELRRRFRR